MAEKPMRVLIKLRAEIQFIQSENQIIHKGRGNCFCGKLRSMKHLISCCPNRAHLITKRDNNAGRIIVQVIEATNIEILV
jgi:hypothetical protein